MMKNGRILIHLHIPKTAGTTLRRIIDRHYPRNAIYTISDLNAKQGEEILGLPEQRRHEIKLLRGHMAFGLHEHFDKSADYFTLLRDPVERIISLYYYLRKSPTLPLAKEVVGRNMSLEDFAASRLSQTLNQQTRLVSGCHDDLTHALEVAKHNLNTHFIAVGISERFDETLILLKRLLGWKHVFYSRQNVTKNRPAQQELPRSAIKLIEKNNALDLELYEIARRKFDQLLDNQESFTEEVRSFQRMNKVYGKVDACVDRMRSAMPPQIKRFIRGIAPGA